MDDTYKEISNQPQSWRATLRTVSKVWDESGVELKSGNYVALFIGCGTSYYLAQSASRFFQEVTGFLSLAVPASEVIFNAKTIIPDGVPLIAYAISRSGTTSEILMAVDQLNNTYSNAHIVGVTCNPDSTLANIADTTIALVHAKEKSVVMTQSFTNMLLALQWVAGRIGKHDDLLEELSALPDSLARQIDRMSEFAETIGSDGSLSQFIYLGLGSYKGLAEEATLKLKEMTQTACEAYNTLEFRHGPISIVHEGTAVVFLTMSANSEFIQDVVNDVKRVGGRTIMVAPNSVAKSLSADDVFVLDDDFSDWARGILYMPLFQYLARARAVKLGLNPDQPRNLSQVVVLKSKNDTQINL